MRLLAWLALAILASVLEVSVLPRLAGGIPPLPLAGAVLVLGIGFQRFWPGFLFAGLAGAFGDVLAAGGVHAFTSVATFFAMHAFAMITQWEEPLGRIGAVAVGLAVRLPLWLVGTHIAAFVFSAGGPPATWRDAAGGVRLGEFSFLAAWFALFAWFEVRRARHRRTRRLRHL